MTSAARTGDRQQAADLGMARCITKPVTHGDLLEALLHAVGSKGATREAAPAPLPPLGQAADAPDVEPRCVLLAEDGVVNQQIVQRLLEMRGHAVTVVSNGREAWEAATRHPYDVVLMDIQMPEMDGFEATARIRAAEQGSDRRTPIVALTAHAMRGDRERCLAAGMDRYLAKPFRPDQLFAAVERLDLDEDDAPGAAAPAGGGADEVWDRAAALALVAGRPSLLADVIHVFLLQCPLQVAEISAALREGDWQAARAGVHALRGAVSAFGARRTLDAARALEQAAQREDSTACRAAEETLLAELASLRQALEAHVRGG
jgi:CheY-like chemotaxis protein